MMFSEEIPPSEFLIGTKEAVNEDIERVNTYTEIGGKYNETTYYSENYTDMEGKYNETTHDNDNLVCPTMTEQGIVFKISNYHKLTKYIITLTQK